MCDDWVDVPLCMFTLSDMCAVFLLVHGTVDDKHLLVHPESSIAFLYDVDVISVGVQSKFNAN
jgi:hypothetical protein